MSDQKIQDICSKLIRMFEDGSFPPAVVRTVINRQAGDDKPCDKWSLCNQLIMIISGTEDARGFRQWQQANRSVKKGAKAFYILAPLTKKVTRTSIDQNTQQEIREEMSIIKGFRPIPVFMLESTEGEELPQYDYIPLQLPPLYQVAEHFGLVRYSSYFNRELGSCTVNGSINLYSHDIDVFFHELGHQVHGTIKPLQGGQNAEQELVAEMVSLVLCQLYGHPGYLGEGWKYLKIYSDQDPSKALKAIMGVLNEVEAVVGKILNIEAELKVAL